MVEGVTMRATRTRFSAFDEPELLGPLPTATVSQLPAAAGVDAVVARIDKELQAPRPWRKLSAMLNTWTHSARDSASTVSWDRAGTATTISMPTWEPIDAAIKPLTLREPVRIETPAPTTAHLDSSIADIQSWLGIGLDETSQVVGISRGTVYAWRQRGSSPRPRTVAAIMRVHGLVASAVKSVGVEQAREWFHAGNPSPLTELAESRGDIAHLRALSTRVRRELLRVSPPPPNLLLAATSQDVVR